MTTLAQSTTVLAALFLSFSSACAGNLAIAPEHGGTSAGTSTSRGPLEIRPVRYEGGSHGNMLVKVKNTGAHTERFSAEGLYFVPKMAPDHAPQRLGAAGPFTLADRNRNRKADYLDRVDIAPGKTVSLEVGVFCIDHHRASPGAHTKFAVAKKRLPPPLHRAIHSGVQRIIRDNGGDVQKAQSAIQDHMWKVRKSPWLPLEGERRHEN